MQKLTYFIFLLGWLLLMTNCAKDTPLVSLDYLETKCGDPWKTNEGDKETEIRLALIDYLENDLMVSTSNVKITFDADAEQSCEACSCTTGRKITIIVKDEFVAILEDNGFVLIK